ncbi:hypothetical protein ACJJTC_010460 [Scirpophaga incertulas]
MTLHQCYAAILQLKMSLKVILIVYYVIFIKIGTADEFGQNIEFMPTVNFYEVFKKSLAEEDNKKGKARMFLSKMETSILTTELPPKSGGITSTLKEELVETSIAHLTTTSKPTSTTLLLLDNSAIPIKKIKVIPQRGIMDVLFPASRVRTFKNVFDTFKRVLSHTFKR